MRSSKNVEVSFVSIFVLLLTLSLPGRGEGEGAFIYKLALPGRQLTFPADHYSHPDFKTEWWYYTGHLESESGKHYGYQVTFFRFGLRDRQGERSFYFGRESIVATKKRPGPRRIVIWFGTRIGKSRAMKRIIRSE